MRLQILIAVGGLAFSLLTLSSVHAATNGGYSVTETRTDNQGRYAIATGFSGTVWVDENVDGIRQPSEPGAAGSFLSFGRPFTPQGDLSYYVNVLYFEPGAKPVKREGNASYTHEGCTFVLPPPRDGSLTVDIRVVQIGKHHLSPRNWPLVDGHFFAKTFDPYHPCDIGFSVTNTDGITFWDTWQRLGLENVGYPISNRFIWQGFVTQAFQKTIFQWQPGRGVFLLNIFDELHKAGKDDALRVRWVIPNQLSPPFESYLPVGKWEELGAELREKLCEEIRSRRLALLDANHAIKERFYAVSDPLLLYGLPTSKVEDYGNVLVIRTQRAAFQKWKKDVPWAKAGEVTVANALEVLKDQFPTALTPQPPGIIGARLP